MTDKLKRFDTFLNRVKIIEANKHRMDFEPLFNVMLEHLQLERPFDFYKFGKDFSSELWKVDLDFDVSQFGEEEFRCGMEIENRYIIFTYYPWTVISKDKTKKSTSVIFAFGIHKDKMTDYHFTVPLGGDFGSVTSRLPDIPISQEKGTDGDKNVEAISMEDEWRLIANAFAYLKSGNPDLREYKPPMKDTPRRERDELIRRFGTEECKLVSWGWKKPIVAHVDSWEVEGHFFWAASGKGREKRVLTWRTGHSKQRRLEKREIVK